MQDPDVDAHPLTPLPLPDGIASRSVEGVNGLTMHVLEAGAPDRPLVLLLHGFPELAYSWRRVMPALAAAGYRVVAPDQRGYGRTTGWDGAYDGDVQSFRPMNLVTDMLALVSRLGRDHVHAVIGHDFGSPVAAWAGLMRPDAFRRAMMMSAPFAGPPALDARSSTAMVDAALAAFDPPRKHYTHFYSTPAADPDMLGAPQGLADFLRAYFHAKSGDFAANAPEPLAGLEGFAKLPTYYVMRRELGMAETVAPDMPAPAEIAACGWLTEEDLGVYTAEYGRTGFQGGLNWYRCVVEPGRSDDLKLFAGRTLDVPSGFIGGAKDWGVFQSPGAFEAMQARACTRMVQCDLIPGAGHWVQQEAPEAVVERLLAFLSR